MSIQTEIAVIQSIVYFIAAIIPVYLTFVVKRKIGNDDNHFKRLTTLLASFILLQGVYPASSYFGYKLLARVLEPLSFGTLIFFAVLYLISKTSAKPEEAIVK